MSIVLAAASAMLILNMIRVAMFARRREIEVMKLVGATNTSFDYRLFGRNNTV